MMTSDWRLMPNSSVRAHTTDPSVAISLIPVQACAAKPKSIEHATMVKQITTAILIEAQRPLSGTWCLTASLAIFIEVSFLQLTGRLGCQGPCKCTCDEIQLADPVMLRDRTHRHATSKQDVDRLKDPANSRCALRVGVSSREGRKIRT